MYPVSVSRSHHHILLQLFINCERVVIDIESRSTVAIATREEINKNLFRRRISASGKPLDELEPNYQDTLSVIELIKKSVENGEKCNIRGKIELRRVSTLNIHTQQVYLYR